MSVGIDGCEPPQPTFFTGLPRVRRRPESRYPQPMLTSLTARLSNLARAAQMLRPRALAQLRKSHQDLQCQVETLETLVQELRAATALEQMSGAIARADVAQAAERATLDTVLADSHRTDGRRQVPKTPPAMVARDVSGRRPGCPRQPEAALLGRSSAVAAARLSHSSASRPEVGVHHVPSLPGKARR